MNYYTDPLLTKLRLIESGQQLNEGLTPAERKELDSLFKELAGFDGVDQDVSDLVAQYKKLPKGGGAGGAKLGRANPGTKAFQNWLNSKGQKVAVDGVYGPATQQAGIALRGDPEYMDMVGVGTAYNVIPGQGLSLNSPEYLAKMKKYGYDPKTGDKIAGGSGAQPAAGAAPVDKLNQLAPKAGPGTEFWVDGSRYEKSARGNWTKTFEPGDWGFNSNQAKARARYTGPNDGEIDQAADQAKAGGTGGAAAQPAAGAKPTANPAAPVPGRPRGGA